MHTLALKEEGTGSNTGWVLSLFVCSRHTYVGFLQALQLLSVQKKWNCRSNGWSKMFLKCECVDL